MKKIIENIRIIFGDISFPKSKAVIIPANAKGIMIDRIPARIVKEGWAGIAEEAKKKTSERKVKIGDFFITGPGRLKRRGTKYIYHAVIQELPTDYISIDIIYRTIQNGLKLIIGHNVPSVAICGLGIEPGNLDATSVARITVDVCRHWQEKIKITIIDDNKLFINEVKKRLGTK